MPRKTTSLELKVWKLRVSPFPYQAKNYLGTGRN